MGLVMPYTIGKSYFLGLIGAKYFIPYIQQVTKIGIHINGIFSMMYPVMGRRKNEFPKKTETRIFYYIFADVYKCPPGAIDKHDDK